MVFDAHEVVVGGDEDDDVASGVVEEVRQDLWMGEK